MRPALEAGVGGLEVRFRCSVNGEVVWVHERHLIFEDIKYWLEYLHIPYSVVRAEGVRNRTVLVLRIKCESCSCAHGPPTPYRHRGFTVTRSATTVKPRWLHGDQQRNHGDATVASGG